MGGITSPTTECAAMQNDLNKNGSLWSDDEYNNWLDEYIAKGCTHAVITPVKMKQN